MRNGMLWFNNSKKVDTELKIKQAAEYYLKKYQRAPNLCLINPDAFSSGLDIPGVTIKPYPPVLPGHIWIGIDDQQKEI